MYTLKNRLYSETIISEADKKILDELIESLGTQVTLAQLGHYSSMNINEIWMRLVIQICVNGSAKFIENLNYDSKKYLEFQSDISFSRVAKEQDKRTYISGVLRKYSATRFHNKSADTLSNILASSNIFFNDQVLLLNSLSHKNDAILTRDKLIERCPNFRLKSASDFMINIGLSHDVIALDNRVVGFFEKKCDYNFKSQQVQSNRNVYLSLESALREYCQQKKISLAAMDRLIFKYGNSAALHCRR